ncbi:MAG: DUF4391 domain-containing protein [Hyphomicrobiales bacterium]|nr:DUF4391 domain-containing protein [Hyphomicrobiales bacterium]
MSTFFDYPKGAKFGRVLTKKKIYQHARASSKLQQHFVDQVNRVVWKYKLAPETINLDATKSVAEIQVFEITLRTAECDEDILRAIDKAIPFPIIFELNHGGKRKAIAAYKRPSEADNTKWVVSEYFASDWEVEDNPRQPLPAVLNLGALYDRILSTLIPAEAGTDEPIVARVERMEMIRIKQREIERIKSRMNREKQFNKRIAINAELRAAQQQFEQITGRKS